MSGSVAQWWNTRLACEKPHANPQPQVERKKRKKNMLSAELTFAEYLKR